MAAHNIPAKLTDQNAVFPASGMIVNVVGNGFMYAWGPAAPTDGATGYGKGCIYQNSALTGVGNALYVNIGTSASASWKVVTIAP
jgi:hypothetical protein